MLYNIIFILLIVGTPHFYEAPSAGLAGEVSFPFANATQSGSINVSFSKVTDFKAISKAYPFLASQLDGIAAEEGTEAYIAKAKTKSGSLLFLKRAGPLYRGTEGTPVDIYLDKGQGYALALSVVALDGIKVLDLAPLSIILSSRDEKHFRWQLDNRTGRFKKT